MRVSLNVVQPRNNFINVAQVNRGIRGNNPATQGGVHSSRRDRSDISPAGKAANLIEQLMSRKQEIIDNKSKLVESTLKNGGTMDSIKSQLESYEEQLKAVDEQLADAMAPKTEKPDEKKENTANDAPKTKEEIQSARINALTDIASDIERTKTVSSSKDGLDRAIRVLKSEIRQDSMHSAPTEAAADYAAKKQGRVDLLERRSSDLASSIGNQLIEANEDLEQTSKLNPTIDDIDAERAAEQQEDKA